MTPANSGIIGEQGATERRKRGQKRTRMIVRVRWSCDRNQMRGLNFELMKLVQKNRDGSYATRDARSRILAQAANELHDLGYRGLKAHGLKSKHVEALVRQ